MEMAMALGGFVFLVLVCVLLSLSRLCLRSHDFSSVLSLLAFVRLSFS